MRRARRPLYWRGGALQTTPFSPRAVRTFAGRLLRRVQRGQPLAASLSRPLPAVGERCHEMRVRDGAVEWRVVYRIDPDAVLVLEVFAPTTPATPRHVIEASRWRLKRYDQRRKVR